MKRKALRREVERLRLLTRDQAAAPPRITLSAESAAVLARAASPSREYSTAAGMFEPAALPPGVKAPAMAMDDALTDVGAWAYGGVSSFASGGLATLSDEFPCALPMPVLAVMAQRAEFWKIADTPAVEMTRRWITIRSTDDTGGSADRIAGINAALKRLKVRDAFRDAIRNDGLMGRGHIYLDFGDLAPDELKTPIGTGGSGSRAKVKRGSLRAVRSVDPMWVYARSYQARRPLAPDWYRPTEWGVMQDAVHASRLLTIVAREVRDVLKPAYSFGGLSLTQMAAPYVQNWLRTRQDVSDLIHAFNTYVLKTNMAAGMQGGVLTGLPGLGQSSAADGASLDARVQLFTLLANNRGVFLLDKDSEEFSNVTAQLGTLDKLQAQAQEQMAAVASQPLVKMFGITPSGLNATADGEIRVWYDHCHAMQEDHVREPLETVVNMIQLSEFGDINDTIEVVFEPLWAMSEKDRADLEKQEADTDQVYVNLGALRPEEVRGALAKDPDNRYQGLDVDDVPDLSEEEAEGLEPDGSEAGDAEGEAGKRAVEGLFRDRAQS